jgi:hypothetical protein
VRELPPMLIQNSIYDFQGNWTFKEMSYNVNIVFFFFKRKVVVRSEPTWNGSMIHLYYHLLLLVNTKKTWTADQPSDLWFIN